MDMVTNLRSTKFPRSVKLLLNAHVMMRRVSTLGSSLNACFNELTELILFVNCILISCFLYAELRDEPNPVLHWNEEFQAPSQSFDLLLGYGSCVRKTTFKQYIC